MVCLWCSLPLLTLAHAQLGPGENPLPKIAKEGEQDFNQMAAANVNNVARLYFASLGVFDYFWFLVHAYVAKIWDTTWYKHGQLHTSLAISPSHALIFTHFATCWKVHGMSATGQRNPLQFEYLTDFWCALAAQLDLIEGFEPWDFWNIEGLLFLHSLSIPECWIVLMLGYPDAIIEMQVPMSWVTESERWPCSLMTCRPSVAHVKCIVLKGYAHLSWFIQCQLVVDCILYCRYCDHWCTSLDIGSEVEYRDYVQGIVPSITALLQVFREALGKQWGEIKWNALKQERKSSCLWWHVSFVWLWSVVGFTCCQPFGIQLPLNLVWVCYNVLYGHPKRHATEYCFIYRWSECSSVVWRLSGMSPFSFPAMSLCVCFKKANLPIFWSTWWRWGPEDGFFNSMDRFYGPIGQGPEGLVEPKKTSENVGRHVFFFSPPFDHINWWIQVEHLVECIVQSQAKWRGSSTASVPWMCVIWFIMSLCMWCTLRDRIECNHLDFALAKKIMFILRVLGIHNIPSGNGCSAADAGLLILNSHSGCAPRSSSEDAGRKETCDAQELLPGYVWWVTNEVAGARWPRQPSEK